MSAVPVGKSSFGRWIRVLPALILPFLILLLGGCGLGSRNTVEDRIRAVENGLLVETNDPPWKRLRLKERMAHYNVPGVSIAVINDYQIEWAKGYGLLEANGEQRVSPNTLFQTGSIAKPIVALTAMHFVDLGLLDLDRDVNEQLVSWQIPPNSYTGLEKVTLRQLLSHSAGVTVEGFVGYKEGEPFPTLREILDGLPSANSPPVVVDMVPGTQQRYSGGGYLIVQQLLEDVTGQPLPEILRQVVLAPLGMTASFADFPLPENLQPLAAHGHRADGSPIPGGWHNYPEVGAGASMWSTPTDMARFALGVMEAYNGGLDGVLSQELAVLMLSPQIDDRGLGPLVYDDGGDRFYFMHPGANDGYKSVLVAYPERGQGVVIMTNSDNGDQLWREILNSVSLEYGWVSNKTVLYAGALTAIALALLGIRYQRSRSAMKRCGIQP